MRGRRLLAALAMLCTGGCDARPPASPLPAVVLSAPAPAPPPPPSPPPPQGTELVSKARAILGPAWRDANRAKLRAANQASNVEPTEAQFEAQLDAYQEEQVAPLFVKMTEMGGPDVLAFCLAIAEDGASRTRIRRMGVEVVGALAPPTDASVAARRAAAVNDITAREIAAKKASGNVPDAVSVVAGLAKSFRRCYNHELTKNPNLVAKGRLTVKIDASGAVTSSVATGLPPDLTSCVEAVGAAAVFAPPEGGGATVVIPIGFVSK